MKLLLYVPQVLLSLIAVFIIVRSFISLYSMRPAGRPKAILLNKFDESRILLTTYETSFGRGRSCDVQLSSQLASRAHAVISRRKKGWFITDTNSKSGTYVNGERITEPVQIYHDDNISMGGVDYVFIAPHARKDSRISYRDKVKITGEESYIINKATGYKYSIEDGQLTIGRSDANDIVISDPRVSRSHALIQRTSDGWFVVDTDSAAGVGVNGYKVNGREELSDGDVIMINTHQFLFRLKKRGGARRGRK